MWTYYDRVEGRRRIKQRYKWAMAGFLFGIAAGVTLRLCL